MSFEGEVERAAPAALAVRIGHASAAGRRPDNEDFVGAVTPAAAELASKGVLVAVADGVSGSDRGQEAAEYTVRGLLADYYATPETWHVPLALERVTAAINNWLVSQAGAKAHAEGMACTLSALVLRGTRWYLAHAGDTRIYRLRDGMCEVLTEDHVWDRPELRHVLKRAVGLDRHLALDHADGELRNGDVFLLCSDGVWEPLGRTRLQGLLAEHAGDPQRAAHALVEAALAHGGNDNATAAVVTVDAVATQTWRDLLGEGRHLVPPPRLKRGQRIDDFEILELIHESRATLIYRVRAARSGRELALKTLQPRLADDRQSCEGLLAEEWLAKRLVSNAFSQVIPLAPAERSYLYYVMTWHEGSTLQQQLDRGRHFGVAEAVEIGLRLARALGALHRLAIVHRDVKPANLLQEADGTIRVLDLGVALAGGVPYPELDGNPGTPSYMSPELFAAAPASPQSDLYAAGVTLYHLLTRRYPYGEVEPFQHPRFGDPVPPTRYRPDIPQWLENLLLRAVAREADRRFETAEEMLLALERGGAQPLPVVRPTPILLRDPVRVWQGIAAISLILNLLLIYLALVR